MSHVLNKITGEIGSALILSKSSNGDKNKVIQFIEALFDASTSSDSEKILHKMINDDANFKRYDEFFSAIRRRVVNEVESNHLEWNRKLAQLGSSTNKKSDIMTWFFPENDIDYTEESVENVRSTRKVKLTSLGNGIQDPVRQILFTSNILLTMPNDKKKIPEELADQINFNEEQKYWFDHPIPLDIPDESNEIIYGLTHLNKAVKVESNQKLTVVLSVSCTHPTLKKIAKKYIKQKISKNDMSHLNVYVFTEDDVQNITMNVFAPLLKHDTTLLQKLYNTFGVDGKYGRHYSFLKAIASYWHAFVDPEVIATYKIDLDQVFTQERMIKETGSYALEKLKNQRWGATAVDTYGNKVKLGMVAGSLVNDCDFPHALFAPDVKQPSDQLKLDQYIFNSSKPQYLSTLAEMNTFYKKEEECILRFHITGGMNGILVDELNRYRPFTPRFIGRAEDQAYVLSTLFDQKDGAFLRCYHQDYFVMRHDKGTFLTENLKENEIPKLVGDYERILLFSHYANDILGELHKIKDTLYPFTGCFISEMPYTLIYYRILLKTYELSLENEKDAEEFLNHIVNRLSYEVNMIESGIYKEQYEDDKAAWNGYYDLLTKRKSEIDNNRAKALVMECRVV